MGNADFDNKFTDVVARNIWKPSSVFSIMKKESVNVAKDINFLQKMDIAD